MHSQLPNQDRMNTFENVTRPYNHFYCEFHREVLMTKTELPSLILDKVS